MVGRYELVAVDKNKKGKIIVSKKDFYLICLHESIRNLTRFLKIITKFHRRFIMFIENVKEFCSFGF